MADLRTPDEVDAHVPAHDLTFHSSFPELNEGRTFTTSNKKMFSTSCR